MKNVPTSTVEIPASTQPVLASENADAYAKKIESVEVAVQRARDIACMFAYLTQDINDDSQHITLDLQALRGVMQRIWGDLDQALVSFREAHELFLVLAKKPTP